MKGKVRGSGRKGAEREVGFEDIFIFSFILVLSNLHAGKEIHVDLPEATLVSSTAVGASYLSLRLKDYVSR